MDNDAVRPSLGVVGRVAPESAISRDADAPALLAALALGVLEALEAPATLLGRRGRLVGGRTMPDKHAL